MALPYVEQQARKNQEELEEMGYLFEPFETNMIVEPDRRIVSLSDLHADLEAFIIALRDCAKVIRKQSEYTFNPKTHQDIDLMELLELDINNPSYDRALHYEWCGENTIVVVVGDLIDGNRHTHHDPITGRESLYHPQIELKLLHFINAINEDALFKTGHIYGKNGRIIKLCGNHELVNFRHAPQDVDWIRSYMFNLDRANPDYYDYLSREEVFEFRNPGFTLYQETTGVGVILKINNTIFVHAELSNNVPDMTLDKLDEVNIELNQKGMKPSILHKIIPVLEHILQGRTYGNPQGGNIGGLQVERRIEDPVKKQAFCTRLRSNISHLCGDGEHKCVENRTRVVVGHCQQLHSMTDRHPLTTIGHLVSRDETTEVFDNVSGYTGVLDVHHTDENRTFGITSECELDSVGNGRYEPQLINVDVAVGRGQWETDEIYKNLAMRGGKFSEKEFFQSRSPQVLEIVGDRVSIIRSSIENSARHLMRPSYQALVRTIAHDIRPLAKQLLDDDEEVILHLHKVANDVTKINSVREIAQYLFHTIYVEQKDDLAKKYAELLMQPSIYEGKKRLKKLSYKKKKRVYKRSKKRV